mmetsp:Transcript_34384/g.109831  ORF Transcript_34384/g.109831 Transcript_34384/m.109831 type:complete len:203 (+) Transcript_34384:52-660(+)
MNKKRPASTSYLVTPASTRTLTLLCRGRLTSASHPQESDKEAVPRTVRYAPRRALVALAARRRRRGVAQRAGRGDDPPLARATPAARARRCLARGGEAARGGPGVGRGGAGAGRDGFGRREPSPGGAGRGAPLARPVAGNECGAGRGARARACGVAAADAVVAASRRGRRRGGRGGGRGGRRRFRRRGVVGKRLRLVAALAL